MFFSKYTTQKPFMYGYRLNRLLIIFSPEKIVPVNLKMIAFLLSLQIGWEIL